MESAVILDIRKQLVDQATAVLETSEMVAATGLYPEKAEELRAIYKRMMEIFCEIKLVQAG